MNTSFIDRVRNLFTGKWTRDTRPSKEERQVKREITHSIASDAAGTATLYSMLLILQHYVARHGSPEIQATLAEKMAQYERGEVASIEVISSVSIEIQEEMYAALDAEYAAHLEKTCPEHLERLRLQGLI